MKNNKQKNEDLNKVGSSYNPAVRIVCWSLALLMGVSLLASIIGSLML